MKVLDEPKAQVRLKATVTYTVEYDASQHHYGDVHLTPSEMAAIDERALREDVFSMAPWQTQDPTTVRVEVLG